MATQTGRNWSSGDIVTAANLSSIERGVSTLAEDYTPTTWANGDTVTAAALNKIEQGVVDAGYHEFDLATITFDLTVPEGYEVATIGISSMSIPYPTDGLAAESSSVPTVRVASSSSSSSSSLSYYNCVPLPIEYTGSIQVLMYKNEGYVDRIRFLDSNDDYFTVDSISCSDNIIRDDNSFYITGDGTISCVLSIKDAPIK